MKSSNFLKIASLAKIDEIEVNKTLYKLRHIYEHPENKFAEVLATKLGFSYEHVSPADGEYGQVLPNGNWTGMLGMLQRGEADLIIYRLSSTLERATVIDFSYPYYVNRFTFATVNPERYASTASFLYPFSVTVWISLLMMILTLPIVFSVLFRRKYSFRNIVCRKLPQTNAECVFVASCKISALFLTFIYAAVLLSFLTVPAFVGVKTISDLAVAVADGKYECITTRGTFAANTLVNSSDSNSRVIGLNLQNSKGTNNILEVLGKTKNGIKSAYIEVDTRLEPLKPAYFVSNDGFMSNLRSIGIKKGFCCKDQLNKLVMRMWSSGIYNKFQKFDQYIKSFKYNQQFSRYEEAITRPLSLEDFLGLFIFLAVGNLIAVFVLLIEINYGRR